MNTAQSAIEEIPGEPPLSKGQFSPVASYGAGLLLSVLLTCASFGVAVAHAVWGPSVPILLAVLAIGQMGVHLVFFFHLSSSPDAANNILALAFGTFVVALVIFGSMIIMRNLDANMMDISHMIEMQR